MRFVFPSAFLVMSLLSGCADRVPHRAAGASRLVKPLAASSPLASELRPGDHVEVEIGGGFHTVQFDCVVGADGDVTLPLGLRVVLSGRSCQEAASVIHDAYVPSRYRRLDVTVRQLE